jgi:hypothetical protein
MRPGQTTLLQQCAQARPLADAGQRQRVDTACQQGQRLRRLLLGVVVAEGQQHHVAGLGHALLEGLQAAREDGVVDRRHDDTDGAAAAQRHRPRPGVRHVAQPIDGAPARVPQFRAHAAGLVQARDTVAVDTPAARATSLTVGEREAVIQEIAYSILGTHRRLAISRENTALRTAALTAGGPKANHL